MNKRFLTLIAFALGVALVASGIVYRLLISRVTSAPTPSAKAFLAVREATIGSLLRSEDLKQVEWKGQLPKQAITVAENAVGRGVAVPLHSGDLVMESHLAPKGAGAGLAVKIPAGKRAVAVKVNEVVGLAGYVLPGMHVDVIACGTPPGDSKNALGTQSRTVLQNIEVLSAGQNINTDAEGKPVTVQVVNLLVTPEEAEVISLAGNETRIQLVLRNPGDAETTKTQGTATAYLFKGRPGTAAPVRSAAPPVRTVVLEKVVVPITMEVISGAKRQDMKVGENVEERPKQDKKR